MGGLRKVTEVSKKLGNVKKKKKTIHKACPSKGYSSKSGRQTVWWSGMVLNLMNHSICVLDSTDPHFSPRPSKLDSLEEQAQEVLF